MNRINIVIIMLIVITPVSVYGQHKIFQAPASGSDAFRMKVVKNGTVVIAEDSAYVYSIDMVGKIGELQQKYLSCLSLRDKDLNQVGLLLVSLSQSYAKVEDLINKTTATNKDQINQYQRQLSIIISDLGKDVNSLKELESRLDNSRKELDDMKSQVRKLRHRIWWKKTGGIIVAAVAGVAVGFAVASF